MDRSVGSGVWLGQWCGRRERSRKGWYVTTIPGGRVSGKLLHYYVEARDAKEKVAASNGKASSPNVVTVKPAGAFAKAKKH